MGVRLVMGHRSLAEVARMLKRLKAWDYVAALLLLVGIAILKGAE